MKDYPLVDPILEKRSPWTRAQRVVLAVVACLMAIAGLAGCSSEKTDNTGTSPSPSQTTSTATATPSADVCADVATAQASLQVLVGTEILREGTDTLNARFGTFKSDVQALVESGQAEFATKVEPVKTSLATLADTIASLKQDPTAAEAALIKPSLQAVKTSTEELIAAVGGTC